MAAWITISLVEQTEKNDIITLHDLCTFIKLPDSKAGIVLLN
jgi:hypothetical protein